MTASHNRLLPIALFTIFYAAIIIALVLMYGKGDFSTPSFIYQNF